MQTAEHHSKLRGFERVKKFVLIKEDFTVENGLLTSTFKIKRHVAKKHFRNQIAQMYAAQTQIRSKM